LPRVILIENVPGFIQGRSSAVRFIAEELQQINALHGTAYKLEYRRIDAVQFGVPQRRQRAILIARRDGTPFSWPTPTHDGSPVRAYDALRNLREKTLRTPSGKWADLLPSIPEGQNYLWHTSKGGGKELFGYRTRYWSFLLKLSKDAPSWTLPASPGPATGPFHWNNRPLTIREMLRLQSFPASWRIHGDYRDQVRQIGNATPPLLAETVARAIGEQVFGIAYRRPPRMGISRGSRVPPPGPVSSVPKKYQALEGKHLPHPGTGLGPSPRISRKREQYERSRLEARSTRFQRKSAA